MPNYKYKYLRVREKPDNWGKTVCRVNVSHLTATARKAEWDRLDAKYPTDKYISCYEQTNEKLPCWEAESIDTSYEHPIVITESIDKPSKYHVPDSQDKMPYFSPEVVKKYENDEDILYLTEGVFKSWEKIRPKTSGTAPGIEAV